MKKNYEHFWCNLLECGVGLEPKMYAVVILYYLFLMNFLKEY